ncbi:heterokaryon incompatibility protein-domain-containing protein [Biscogniauxia marginata]|nr:heterokaryon incompatibility protein-domain-containing protein [Biscogniauxia marginata]
MDVVEIMLLDSLTRRVKHDLPKRSYSPEQHEAKQPKQENQRRGTPGYPYQDLVDTDIRLIKILPGAVQDDIECYLDQMPLSTDPKYYALSYVWGDDSIRRTITVNGQPFQITNNLHEALHQFRQFPEHGYLDNYFWVDAICINQEDLDERSHEVSRMMEIYRSSLQVLVWLGPNGPPANSAFKKLLRNTVSYRNWVPLSDRQDVMFGPEATSPDDIIEMMFEDVDELWLVLPDDPAEELKALRKFYGRSYNAIVWASTELLQRSWFSRTWTLQEACVKGDTLVYAGRHSIDLERLIPLLRVLGRHNRFQLFSPGGLRLRALDDVRNMFRAIFNKDPDWDFGDNPLKMDSAEVLIRLLRISAKKKSADPRDQIYGLLGILDFLIKFLPKDLAPNYRLSYEEVYWQYAVFILRTTRDLRILSCRHRELQNVPSWVPDFRYCDFVGEFKREPSVVVSRDKKSLQLQGLLMGEVRDHIAECRSEKIGPSLHAIPGGLSSRIQSVEDRILEPSATLRGIALEQVLGRFLKGSPFFSDDDLGYLFQVFRYLREPSSQGERSWLERRKITRDNLTKETILADEFMYHLLLLTDGTIIRLRRMEVEIEPGDAVCLFKGSMFPSLVRPHGEEYILLGQCDILGGMFHDEELDDDFWVDKEVQHFNLV